ncbi:hypothetical protein [Pseudonocardia sp. KRD291]|uniref:hypothetical protein n=1 Tax=Pseudonocardia sp. KRD291 TaxID=2792007 RepID=UPI001C4A30EF|nr:hypothetical protein [Pseudonocardia sp. KRD291]MBW0105343.1 hypothetical protein [Pseudonocardia sp. KRD291]
MCGACGGAPPDPFGARVAGPRRRAAVARVVDARLPNARVRAVPGGWTVSGRTGRVRVCRTLDELIGAAAPGLDTAGDGEPLRNAVLDAADAVG